FSSRRRHTRSKRDWSSDVCSSDLVGPQGVQGLAYGLLLPQALAQMGAVLVVDGTSQEGGLGPSQFGEQLGDHVLAGGVVRQPQRSEERRVGKERVAKGRRERRRQG